jgi:hypothetical protein
MLFDLPKYLRVFLVHLFIIYMCWVFERMCMTWCTKLLSSQKRNLQKSIIGHSHDKTFLFIKSRSLDKYWCSYRFGSPHESHILVHHQVTVVRSYDHHETWSLKWFFLTRLHHYLASLAVLIFIDIGASCFQVIGLDTTWSVVKSSLVSNFSLLVQYENGRLRYNKNINCLRVLIEMSYKLTRLFT